MPGYIFLCFKWFAISIPTILAFIKKELFLLVLSPPLRWRTPGSLTEGLFISVGAAKGKRLFDGVLLTVKYFFDAADTEMWRSLLYRGLDFEGDVLKYPEYLEEAYTSGKGLVKALAPR
jgi:hypothetical protein